MEWPNANLLGWFTHHLKCYKATFLNYYFGGCYGFISYGLGMTAQKLHRTKYLSLGIFTGGKIFKVWTKILLELSKLQSRLHHYSYEVWFFQLILTSSFFWPLKTKRKSTAASKLVEKQSHTEIWNAGTENQTVVFEALAWGLLRVGG